MVATGALPAGISTSTTTSTTPERITIIRCGRRDIGAASSGGVLRRRMRMSFPGARTSVDSTR